MRLTFTQRLEQTQYSAALAVTGAWRGTNRQRLYDELGWNFLVRGMSKNLVAVSIPVASTIFFTDAFVQYSQSRDKRKHL